MPKACAVRKCKTGYTSLGQKCSVFKRPRNIEQFKKWQAAIPGVVLKQLQYICEKHFNENCIIRQWIKRDANGKIIAQTAYERPRLIEAVVPTIFKDSGVVQSATPACSECEDEPLEYILGTAQSSTQPDVVPLEQVQHDYNYVQLVVIPPQDTMEAEIMSPNAIVEQKKLQAKDENITDCSRVPPRSRNFGISDILVNDGNTVVSSGNKGSIIIPKFWGCKELLTERGQSIVFSHLESKRVNGAEVPVIERSIIVDPDNRLPYSLCGHAFDTKECKLTEVLEERSLLAETLEKFRKMRACGGLGAE